MTQIVAVQMKTESFQRALSISLINFIIPVVVNRIQ